MKRPSPLSQPQVNALADLLAARFPHWEEGELGARLLLEDAGFRPAELTKPQSARDGWLILLTKENRAGAHGGRLDALLHRAMERLPAIKAELDPFLAALHAPPQPHHSLLPEEPYPGLVPFTEGDALLLAGRGEDLAALRATLAEGPPITLLTGPSGVGKTSLVHAGLLPALRTEGRLVLSVDAGIDPLKAVGETLCRALDEGSLSLVNSLAEVDRRQHAHLEEAAARLARGRQDPHDLSRALSALGALEQEPTLVLDRLDPLLASSEQHVAPALQLLLASLRLAFAPLQRPPARLLLLVRREHLGRLDRLLSDQLVSTAWRTLHLGPIGEREIQEALGRPCTLTHAETGAPVFPFQWEEAALLDLSRALAALGPLRAPTLQIIARRAWERLPIEGGARTITLPHLSEIYGITPPTHPPRPPTSSVPQDLERPTPGSPLCVAVVERAQKDHLAQILAHLGAAAHQQAARRLLRQLVVEGEGGPRARGRTEGQLCAGSTPKDGRALKRALAQLIDARLVQISEEGEVRLAHDSLAGPVLAETRDVDLAAQRASRSFTRALEEYRAAPWWRRRRYLLEGARYAQVRAHRRACLAELGFGARVFWVRSRLLRFGQRASSLGIGCLFWFLVLPVSCGAGGYAAVDAIQSNQYDFYKLLLTLTFERSILDAYSDIEAHMPRHAGTLSERLGWMEHRLAALEGEWWTSDHRQRLQWALRIAARFLAVEARREGDDAALKRAQGLWREVRALQPAALQAPLHDPPGHPCLPEEVTAAGAACEQVLIPAGPFWRGDESAGYRAEQPASVIWLSTYALGRYEVSLAEFRPFVEAGGSTSGWPPKWVTWFRSKNLGAPALPASGVSYYDAASYCEWAGGRLPSEAQWEKAARGPLCPREARTCLRHDDLFWEEGWTAACEHEGDPVCEPPWNQRTYPWGAAFECGHGAYSCEEGKSLPGLQAIGTAEGGTDPGPYGYGIVDLTGNVAEWTSSWWSPDGYASENERAWRHGPWTADPEGMGLGDPLTRSRKGSSYFDDSSAWSRAGARRGAGVVDYAIGVGFRCAFSSPGLLSD